MDSKWNWETELQHAGPIELEKDNWPLVPPIFQSVKYHAADLESYEGKRGPRYVYSRLENPTLVHLEKMLARVQATESGLVTASGMAAVAVALLGNLKAGDHVLFFAESYRPTRAFIKDFLGGFGITHSMLLMEDVIGDIGVFERAIQAGKTRVVIFESPTNPMTRIAPLTQICRSARTHGVMTILDATLAGLHQNRDVDVDLYVHSLTKYAGGHGDVLAGAILGSHKLIERLRGFCTLLGPSLDPHAASMIMRGMKTYAIRYRTESANALAFARRLEQHPAITRVFYPGLPSHPDYSRAAQHLQEFGSVLSFELKGLGDPDRDRLRLAGFIKKLKLTALAPSLGSTETLLTPVRLSFAGDLSPETVKRVHISELTLRVSVGLECVEDLWQSWSTALENLD